MRAQALAPPIDAHSLHDVDVAFIDHRAVLDAARQLGLPERAEIRTLSPSLGLDPTLRVSALDAHVEPEERARLAQAVYHLTRDLFDALQANPALAPLGIVAAQQALGLAGLVVSAMMLRASDATSKLAVVHPETKPWPTGMANATHWQQLLAGRTNLTEMRTSVPPPDADAGPTKELVSFLDRQRLGRGAKIAYQLTERFWRRAPITSPRGTYLILRENFLLREAALSLAFRGFGLGWLSSAQGQAETADSDDEIVARISKDALERHIKTFVQPFVWPQLSQLLVERIVRAVRRFRASLASWRTSLPHATSGKPRGVLTNMLMLPDTAALHVACRERGIPIFAFQHGTAREIASNNLLISAYFEGNTSDYFLTFSPAAAAVSRQAPYNRAESFAVGLPAMYSRCATYRRSRSRAPTILFISSTLYAGHYNQMISTRGLSDIELARNDVTLVSEVLARIPYRVVLKPYPAIRYLDPDPVIVAADRTSNIEVFRARDDVSFLLPDADIVLSARATSSISWGAISGKPFVLIDHPGDNPLVEDARVAFSEAFFVFDRTAPDFVESLRTFLSQPLADIRIRWERKAAAREAALNWYLGRNDAGAGARSADFITAV